MADALNRNDPCHCESGKKYKNCCIEKDKFSLKSNLGVIGLALVAIFGVWLLAANFSSSESAQNCPSGTTWSDAHAHCH
jgi:hypothetical protein